MFEKRGSASSGLANSAWLYQGRPDFLMEGEDDSKYLYELDHGYFGVLIIKTQNC
jgi:hypothetical protein